MKVFRWQKFLNNPYQYLLGSLILLLLFFPFANQKVWLQLVLFNVLFLATILSVIGTFQLRNRIKCILNIIAILSFISTNTFNFYSNDYPGMIYYWFGEIVDFIFISISVLIIVRKIFKDQKITGDTLRGGISVYLMLGILWFQIYSIIYKLDNNAFSRPLTQHEIVYFSFVTLTTVGYGDITPINPIAMTFANLEAIVGQLYPAIIIARLVSLYTISNSE